MSKEIIKSYRDVTKKKGEPCPRCKQTMERRSHADIQRFLKGRLARKPNTKYYFSEWDYCISCKHVQHYEKFRRIIPQL